MHSEKHASYQPTRRSAKVSQGTSDSTFSVAFLIYRELSESNLAKPRPGSAKPIDCKISPRPARNCIVAMVHSSKAFYLPLAIRMAPTVINPTPKQPTNERRSLRNNAAITATRTTLSLSMEATCAAWPMSNARK